ncbi:e7049923-cc4b-4385-ba9e-e2a86723d5bb-CDS [Sclerotinia trifoliorum]|uniref:E7049923-cc4b-4385-ba9e-e2a86723d5bb-CDS n=1 Tax=Sclerotinia trifoliorum TaxID=28548 RepID=A0A8H2VS58_9HELO|nr:e7049923-cc4b-4385-ba9e-e2a86723d5bb-CDS [Sclerotinia trifoliorum]
MSAARASKAAVALSIIQFLTLVGLIGFFARAIHKYRAACSTTSAHARQVHSSLLHQRPVIGGTYRMRETYERNVPTQSRYRNRDEGMQVCGHVETIEVERSEENDGRTDFWPAFV